MTLDTRYLFQCKYCSKRFMKERHFMTHECMQMKRAQEVQTAVGQQAYQMYKLWLEKQRKKAPAIDAFATSTFYTSFIKFAHYCRDHSITAHVEVYVDLMVKQGISPALWSRPECYQQYIEYLDKRADPYTLGEQTIATLIGVADRLRVPVSSVFEELKYGEVIHLLETRRISPWFLLCSGKFKAWVSKLDPHEREHLYRVMGVGYWADALERKPDVVKDMKILAQGVEL